MYYFFFFVKITHNDKDTWTLTIKDVKPKDAGEYMCQINSVPMVTQVNISIFLINDRCIQTDK